MHPNLCPASILQKAVRSDRYTARLDRPYGQTDRTRTTHNSLTPNGISTCHVRSLSRETDRTRTTHNSLTPNGISTCHVRSLSRETDRTRTTHNSLTPNGISTYHVRSLSRLENLGRLANIKKQKFHQKTEIS